MYDIDKLILHEYSGQEGYGSLPYFVGKQYGTGWLRNIARMAFPFLRKALGVVGNIAVNTAGDLVNDENKSVGSTLIEHAVKETRNAFNRKPTTPLKGQGLKRKRVLSINRGGVSKKGKLIF